MIAAPLVGMQRIAAAIGALPTCRRLQRLAIRRDEKPASGKGMIVMRREPTFGFGAKVQARDRRLHAWPVLGKGVEESRHEHVA